MDNFQAQIASKLLQKRTQMGWSQEHMGELFGNYFSYQKLEQGRREIKLEEAIRIADIFEIPVDELWAQGKRSESVNEMSGTYSLAKRNTLQVSVVLDGSKLGLERQIQLLTKVNAALEEK